MDKNVRFFQLHFLCPAISCPKEDYKVSNLHVNCTEQLEFTLMNKTTQIFKRRDAIICSLVLFHFTKQTLSLMLDEKFSNGKCWF